MPQVDMTFDEVNGRQTAMFSATFPKDIQQLAGDFMADYIFVTVGRVGATAASITQNLEWVEEEQKMFKLLEKLRMFDGLTLVFVETKRMADYLHSELYYKESIQCTAIHGDRSQRDRERALWEFSTQRVQVLIATEVAARGLDIPDVSHVINFDLPTDIDSYVHRIGRTGRAGNTGIATSFVNEKNIHIAIDLKNVLEESQQTIPSWLAGLAGQAEVLKSGGRRNVFTINSKSGGGATNKRFGGQDFRKDQGNVDTQGKNKNGNTKKHNGGAKKNQNSSSNSDSW